MSLPELGDRHAVDVGQSPLGVAAEVEACHQRQQALIVTRESCVSEPKRIGIRSTSPTMLRSEWCNRMGLIQPEESVELLRQ